MSDKAPERTLSDALRQYQHNDGEGLVFAYHKETTERIFEFKRQAHLTDAMALAMALQRIEELEKELAGRGIFTKQTLVTITDDLP